MFSVGAERGILDLLVLIMSCRTDDTVGNVLEEVWHGRIRDTGVVRHVRLVGELSVKRIIPTGCITICGVMYRSRC